MGGECRFNAFSLLLLAYGVKCAAVQAIDEILLKRSQIHLIAGQPLHPLTRPVPGPPAPKKIKKVRAEGSKAASSYEQKLKRAIPMPPSPCILCHSSTPHQYKDCPVVQAGSKRFVPRSVCSETRLIVP